MNENNLMEFTKELEIIFQDDYLVAINKPHGLLVHKTRLSNERNFFALQMLRDQLHQHVFPVHRLDRKTSGALLFALDRDVHQKMQFKFSLGEVNKKYLAIVRGYCGDEGIIDHPVMKENGRLAASFTMYKTIDKAEIEIPFGPHKTSRYSLVEVIPKTGRMHQIRKHFAHINHPIIGDRPHGCNKQNKLFKEKFGLMTMMLHAYQLNFLHPVNGKQMILQAPLQSEFKRMIKTLRLSIPEILERQTKG